MNNYYALGVPKGNNSLAKKSLELVIKSVYSLLFTHYSDFLFTGPFDKIKRRAYI